MKTIKFIVAILLGMFISGRLMAQTDGDKQLVVALSEPGKAYKLDVGLVTGSIKVTGYEGKDIIIDIADEPHRRERESDEHNGMRRISSGDNAKVIAHEKNNVVTVQSELPNKGVSLSIKIPRGGSDIKLATVNGGNVVVNNASGDFEVNNVNGAIELTNISGSVVANTINGRVLVTFRSIDPKAAMAFSTLNGNVDVTFPASLRANIKAKSDRGDVYTDFDMVTDNSRPKAQKTVKEGMYQLSIEDWIYGKIGGGGPEILMKNMHGNIYIRKEGK